jgi:N-acetylglucosamine malate deacetylase 1
MTYKNNVLLITSHCDDAEIWAGGSIQKLKEEGRNIVVGICEYNNERENETLKSSSLIGYIPVFKSPGVDTVAWILELIEDTTPEILLFHPYWDPHPLHKETYRATINAMRQHKSRKEYPLRWYVFDTYYLTRTPRTIPVILDISSYYINKEKAISFHKTQKPHELIQMVKNINQIHGLKIRTEYAEAFYPIDILGRVPKLRESL